MVTLKRDPNRPATQFLTSIEFKVSLWLTQFSEKKNQTAFPLYRNMIFAVHELSPPIPLHLQHPPQGEYFIVFLTLIRISSYCSKIAITLVNGVLLRPEIL